MDEFDVEYAQSSCNPLGFSFSQLVITEKWYKGNTIQILLLLFLIRLLSLFMLGGVAMFNKTELDFPKYQNFGP